MKEKKFSTKVLAEVAIFAAIAFVLDILQGGICNGIWVSGGSVGLAMIPVLVISFRRGFLPGLLCGLIVGLLQLACGPYIIADTWYNMFFQTMLDYILAYPCVALAGLFYTPFQNAKSRKNRNIWLIVGIFVGGIAKFLSHFLAGVLFWSNMGGSFLGIEDSSALYSFVYNGSYVFPCTIIAIIVLVLIDMKAPTILSINFNNFDENDTDNVEEKEIIKNEE